MYMEEQARVVLPWGEYHRLNSHPHVAICTDAEAAWEAREDHSDEILPVRSLTDAARAAETFRHLAWAAWTPNQDRETQDRNGRVMAAAERILERLRDRAARLGIPDPQPLVLPTSTLPAPEGTWEQGPSWRRSYSGLDSRYRAGLQSLLDRPDTNLRLQAVVSRTGSGGGFVVVCRLGDDLRALGSIDPTHDIRLAEADLRFVLRRASSGSGRLILDRPCRRDPASGPPFPRPYGQLTVVSRSGSAEATRWRLHDEDAERLIRRRVLPELAWTWLVQVARPAAPPSPAARFAALRDEQLALCERLAAIAEETALPEYEAWRDEEMDAALDAGRDNARQQEVKQCASA